MGSNGPTPSTGNSGAVLESETAVNANPADAAAPGPVLSIVFVNFNTVALLEQAMRSLLTNAPEFPLEVIVVDNGSTDRAELAQAAHRTWRTFPVRWLCNRRNRGYGAAANQGIALARGEFVAIANTDIRFLHGTLNLLIDFLREHVEAGIVAPQFLWGDMTLRRRRGGCRDCATCSPGVARSSVWGACTPHGAGNSSTRASKTARARSRSSW